MQKVKSDTLKDKSNTKETQGKSQLLVTQ